MDRNISKFCNQKQKKIVFNNFANQLTVLVIRSSILVTLQNCFFFIVQKPKFVFFLPDKNAALHIFPNRVAFLYIIYCVKPKCIRIYIYIYGGVNKINFLYIYVCAVCIILVMVLDNHIYQSYPVPYLNKENNKFQ